MKCNTSPPEGEARSIIIIIMIVSSMIMCYHYHYHYYCGVTDRAALARASKARLGVFRTRTVVRGWRIVKTVIAVFVIFVYLN